MKTIIHFWSYLAQFFLEWEIFQLNDVEKNQNTHFMWSNFFFFWRSCRLWDNVEKCSAAGQITDENTAHAHFTLDT
jgi:hypothetical protein